MTETAKLFLEYGVIGLVALLAILWAWRERQDRINIGDKLGKKLDNLQEARLNDVKEHNRLMRESEDRWTENLSDLRKLIKDLL